MSTLSDRFDDVQRAGDARALALQLKFGVTDFNGWQTAYGYDNGRSRPTFLASVAAFRRTLALARARLTRPTERRLLAEVSTAAGDFMRLDARAYKALQAGNTAEVRRIFLGPEIANFERTARAAQQLAVLEDTLAGREEARFRSARRDALRFMIGASVIAAVLVGILLATALELARRAEQTLDRPVAGVAPAEPPK
jgi:hypothetical protein